ncbi:MAG: hypothetical protein R2746_12320 [Acidimicrobiales bacterium]
MRWLFTCCVQATATTAWTPEIWRRSLDDRLIDYDRSVDLDGYVWGVKWQRLYPRHAWSQSRPQRRLGPKRRVAFHEVTIETNGHDLSLVFADLEVWTDVPAGHVPFAILGRGGGMTNLWGRCSAGEDRTGERAGRGGDGRPHGSGTGAEESPSSRSSPSLRVRR